MPRLTAAHILHPSQLVRYGRIGLDGEPGVPLEPFVFGGEPLEMLGNSTQDDHVVFQSDPVLLFTLRDKAATVGSIIGRRLRVILQRLQERPLGLEQAFGDSPSLEFRDVLTFQFGFSVTFSCLFPVDFYPLSAVDCLL